MRNTKIVLMMLGVLLLSSIAQAHEKTIRATEMKASMWSDLTHGKMDDVVIEFRQGDELPVSFEAQGDLIETRQSSLSYVAVKKNFWLLLNQNTIEISLDGITFKKPGAVLTGSLEASAGSAQNSGVADAINIVFKTFLK